MSEYIVPGPIPPNIVFPVTEDKFDLDTQRAINDYMTAVYDLLTGTRELSDSITRQLVWYVGDVLEVGTGQSATLIVPFNGVLTKCTGIVGIAPTGSDLVIDVNKGGTSIFGVSKLSIAAGSSSGVQETFSSTEVTEGATFTLDIDSIGSTVAGSDLTVLLEIGGTE